MMISRDHDVPVDPQKQKHFIFTKESSKTYLGTTKGSYFYGNYVDRAFIPKYQSRDHDVPDETPKNKTSGKKF